MDYYNPDNPKNCNFHFEKTDLSSFDPTTDPSLRQIGIPSDEFILAIGYKFRPCVLMSDPISDSSLFGIEESFVRLDRMQFVRLEHISPMPISLSEKAFDLLRQWSWFYQGCPILDPSLEKYIEKAKIELEKRIGKL